jgi:hypothetical protein
VQFGQIRRNIEHMAGQSLKNGILFGLVILIFHIAIKATLERDTFDDAMDLPSVVPETRDDAEAGEMYAYALATEAVAAAAGKARSTPKDIQDAALREYVFGDDAAPAQTDTPPQNATTASIDGMEGTGAGASIDGAGASTDARAVGAAVAPALPNDKSAPTAPPPTQPTLNPSLEKFAATGSFATVGQYANESELCGGSMKGSVGGSVGRNGDLKGFDGFYSSCVASVV